MRAGVYETVYGNAAVVKGPNAKKAFDLDMGEWIPITSVNTVKRLRSIEPQDRQQIYRQGGD